MCLLIALNPGASLDRERILIAADNNPDGFGFAIHAGDHLLRFRSMDIHETLDEWEFLRKQYDGAAIFHLRWATHGTVDLSNCHPFEIAHDSRMMLAHNGVLPIAAKNGRSDTRILAETNLAESDPSWLDDPALVADMENYLGGSKLAILSVHPDNTQDMYVLNEDLGHWDGDVWYSNYSYEAPKVPTHLNWTSSSVKEDLFSGCEFVECDHCGLEYLIDTECGAQLCPECESCYWCGPTCYCPIEPWMDDEEVMAP